MRRFHRHIINFSNEAILAYLKAGINAKKTYRDDTYSTWHIYSKA